MLFQNYFHALEYPCTRVAIGEIKGLWRAISKLSITHLNLDFFWRSIRQIDWLSGDGITLCHLNSPIMVWWWCVFRHPSCREWVFSAVQIGWCIVINEDVLKFRPIFGADVHCFLSLSDDLITCEIAILVFSRLHHNTCWFFPIWRLKPPKIHTNEISHHQRTTLPFLVWLWHHIFMKPSSSCLIVCIKNYFIMVPFYNTMTQLRPSSGKFSVDQIFSCLSRSFIFGKNQLSLYQTTSLCSWPSAYCPFFGVIHQKSRSIKYLSAVHKEIFFVIPCLSLTLGRAKNSTIFPPVISFPSSYR